ncbi:MAG: exopolyphosphatase / guanosine-5-triphosphate,3-diphosphate pyrophosphatase [Actinomycetota bacterium]|nr:exopolyphosphatase / guanosine-5-triphosphate,3-diphosphate pyrophosphatase [Actinomycetota bacterium]
MELELTTPPSLTEPATAAASRGRPAPVEATATNRPEVLAAIDIGTNSVHLVVARVRGLQGLEVLEREKEMVRLGSGGGDMKHLDEGAIDRGIAALARFREVADVHDAAVTAVATSAVREAENRRVFLQRASTEAGVDVDIISGVEEARLIHLGVLQAVPVFDQRLLLCDIGGGSTELLIGLKGETLTARSMKLGSNRLTQRFFGANKLQPGDVDSCRREVRAMLSSFSREARRHGYDVAVGSSGTIGAVCAMAVARREEAPPRTWNNFQLSRQDLAAVVKSLVKAPSVAARAKLPGLDPGRADIILAGALILEQVFEEFGIEEMTFSDYALREGVLLDAWQRRHGGSLHHLSTIRRSGVEHLAELMDEDREHSQHVATLALDLFDRTAELHGLGDDAREYLEAAALLCNVGLFLSHAGHHRHTYYVIRNSDLLTGFTDREIELIAVIARYHRKGLPRPAHPEFAALPKADQRLVRACAGLLRIAIGLDRTHGARVAGVEVEVDDGTLTVTALPRNGADIGLELFSAAERTDLLAEALELSVEVAGAT